MSYQPQSADTLRDVPESYLRTNLDNPALDDVDVLGAIVTMVVETLAEEHEQTLATLSDQAFVQTATGDALTRKAREYGVERRDPVRATGVVEFRRDSAAPADFTIAEGTRVSTADGSVTFETTEVVTLADGTTSVKANVRATDGGVDGNLPADRLVSMPSPPTGVESVTNPNPTGDETETDTNGDTLVPGRDRETDEELRERTLESTSIGGAASTTAIETALLDVDGVRTVTVESNSTDSTDADGLPPYSNEVIVAGGNDKDVAEALTDIVAVTELFRLQSGIIGNGVTESIYVNILDQTVNVQFSRPTDVSLDVTVELATTDTYDGDDAIKNNMVEYVGGADTDGATVSGLGAGESVIINRLEDTIVGPETGVNGIASMTVDASGDGSDDRTTNSDGIEVIDIGSAEQAFLDASNISITQV